MNNRTQVVHVRRRQRWPMVLVAVVLLGLIGSSCGTSAGQSFQDGYNAGYGNAPTSASPAPTGLTTTPEPPPVPVTIPEGLEGKNLAIVRDRLTDLGIRNVQNKSEDENDTVIVVEANWTVTGIEPGEGETISSNDVVVVSATKQ